MLDWIIGDIIVEGGLALRRKLKGQRLATSSKRADRKESKLREQRGTAEDPGALDIELPEPGDSYSKDPDS